MIDNGLTFQRQLWPEKKPTFRSEFERKGSFIPLAYTLFDVFVNMLWIKINFEYKIQLLKAEFNAAWKMKSCTHTGTKLIGGGGVHKSWRDIIFLRNNTISWFIWLLFLLIIQCIRFIQWYFNTIHFIYIEREWIYEPKYE